VHDAEDCDPEIWDRRAVRLRDSIIEIWRLIREAQLIDFDAERTSGPKPAQYDSIHEELQLEAEMLSFSMGRDVPNETLKWISFKHRGPPPRRKSFRQLPESKPHDTFQEPIKSPDVGSTHQGREQTNSGPRIGNSPPAAQRLPYSRSCENFAKYTTVEERIQRRKLQGRFLFKRQWKKVLSEDHPETSKLISTDMGTEDIVIEEKNSDIRTPHSEDEGRLEKHYQSLIEPQLRYENDPGPELLDLDDVSFSLSRKEVANQASESLADDVIIPQAFLNEGDHEATTGLSPSRGDKPILSDVFPADYTPVPDDQEEDEAVESISSGISHVSPCSIFPKGDFSVPAHEVHSEHSLGDSISRRFEELPQSDFE
jgi:hypothetical protein